jgi:hypothetical protein
MLNRVDSKLKVAVILLAGMAVAARLLPHAPNLALLGTLAFVSGRYWPRASRWLPLGVAILTDWAIGFYSWPVMLSVWFCYLLTANLGKLTHNVSLRPVSWRPTVSVVALTLIGSALFFLITNTAVWAAGWYPPTLNGWWMSLVNALPFARNTFVSDLSYTVIAIAAIEGLMAVRLTNRHPALVTRTNR